MLSVARQGESTNVQQQPHDDATGERMCRTIPLVGKFSTCLMYDSQCKHAFPFGFTYICRHPRHSDFSNQSQQFPPAEKLISATRKGENNALKVQGKMPAIPQHSTVKG